MVARIAPLFFDASVDPIVTSKTPGAGRDILASSANNLYVGVTMKDFEGFTEKYGLNSRLVKQNGRLVEEVYKAGGRYSRADRADRPPSRGGGPLRDRAHGARAEGPRALVPHRRDGRPRGVRHRVGSGQGLAGRHDQRIRRGLHGPPRDQGLLGSARLLRESREDRGDSKACGLRAVVRRSHAVGSEVSQAGRPGHHGKRHRRRHRDGRFRADHAGRNQPAERSGHS